MKLSYSQSQQDLEKFLEIGEEEFRKDCLSGKGNAGAAKFMERLGDLGKKACELQINDIKKEIGTTQQNESPNSVSGTQTYSVHNDIENGFSLEYPNDWSTSADGMKFFKGSREFTISIYDDPSISLLDTNSFGDMIFDYHKEKDGIKITDNLGQINIGDEPAVSFSYSEVNKEVMAAAILQDNAGYVFKYGTVKDNFDQDLDTMMHFFASIKFQ